MTTRQRIGDLLLILTLLYASVSLGGTVYQMMVVNPEWGGALPGSLPAFFSGSRWPAAFARFWASPVLGLGPLLLLAALAVCWPERRRRVPLLGAVALYAVIAVWTAVYFIPEIEPLFVRAGAGLTPEQVTARAGAWLFWDRVRFILIVAAWLAALLAYRAAPGGRDAREGAAGAAAPAAP